MSDLRITVFDPDTNRVQRAARQLRSFLKGAGVAACVDEVSCYLEISRQGLKGRTPVIAVNGTFFQCRDLERPLLERFSERLVKVQGTDTDPGQ